MDIPTVVGLVKQRLGIMAGTARDGYLTIIAEGVVKELEDEKGLSLEADNSYHLLFVVDYATWRYQSRDSEGAMPRHLQLRLHNLMIHIGGEST